MTNFPQALIYVILRFSVHLTGYDLETINTKRKINDRRQDIGYVLKSGPGEIHTLPFISIDEFYVMVKLL